MKKGQVEILELLKTLILAKSEAMRLGLHEVVYMIQLPIICLYASYNDIQDLDELNNVKDSDIEHMVKEYIDNVNYL